MNLSIPPDLDRTVIAAARVLQPESSVMMRIVKRRLGLRHAVWKMLAGLLLSLLGVRLASCWDEIS